MKIKKAYPYIIWTTLAFILRSGLSHAAEPVANPSTNQGDAEQVDVDSIKKRYWARGKESEMGVVQNRLFSKANKINMGLMGGVLFSDPFVTTNPAGITLGYHFNEFFNLSLVGWKALARESDAHKTFRKEKEGVVNTNYPEAYYGLEAAGSFLYGKLSLAGASIIYYDMHVSGGAGLTKTESGSYVTPNVGLGQRFYVTQLSSLRIDYRFMYYRENVLEKQIPQRYGQVATIRNNFSHVITLGVDFMFNFK